MLSVEQDSQWPIQIRGSRRAYKILIKALKRALKKRDSTCFSNGYGIHFWIHIPTEDSKGSRGIPMAIAGVPDTQP